MTRFERRVRQLEGRAGTGRATIPAEYEIWIELKDGGMLGKDGEIISRKAFEQRRSNAGAILILPDNGRDPDLVDKIKRMEPTGSVGRRFRPFGPDPSV
jgi:hypothetical protein